MNRPSPLAATVLACTVAAVAASALVVNVRQLLPLTEPSTCTVTAKSAGEGPERVEHLQVETAECGTFRIADPVLLGNIERDDLFGSLEHGQTYLLETRGDRIEFLGLHPSIVSATPVN